MTRSPAPAESDGQPPLRLRVDPDRAGQRLDNWLFTQLKGVPKTLLYRLLREGRIRVDGGRAKPERKLDGGETVYVPPIRRATPGTPPAPRAEGLDWLASRIAHEDEALLVLDKPAGLASHGGSGISLGAIEALRAWRQQPGLELVHRLDRDTSGLLMVAKTRAALRELQTLIRDGQLDKRYYALMAGATWRQRFDVQAPLETQERRGGERVVRVSSTGKPALTGFRVLERYVQATLVEATLHTGRTHQIRVHARHAGHPLVGDDKYGDPGVNTMLAACGLDRLCLHAAQLGFRLGGRRYALQSPLPAEIRAGLQRLTPARD
ncbi:MAG: RluA family pseudouridine synthase [Xanthomonadales bacterium]|jgi:23S rRNA pseudouridine955/2504/2580 synthase|nr:RluA family pseudouridine synthase [Xanthomonadales bacterium]